MIVTVGQKRLPLKCHRSRGAPDNGADADRTARGRHIPRQSEQKLVISPACSARSRSDTPAGTFFTLRAMGMFSISAATPEASASRCRSLDKPSLRSMHDVARPTRAWPRASRGRKADPTACGPTVLKHRARLLASHRPAATLCPSSQFRRPSHRADLVVVRRSPPASSYASAGRARPDHDRTRRSIVHYPERVTIRHQTEPRRASRSCDIAQTPGERPLTGNRRILAGGKMHAFDHLIRRE